MSEIKGATSSVLEEEASGMKRRGLGAQFFLLRVRDCETVLSLIKATWGSENARGVVR